MVNIFIVNNHLKFNFGCFCSSLWLCKNYNLFARIVTIGFSMSFLLWINFNSRCLAFGFSLRKSIGENKQNMNILEIECVWSIDYFESYIPHAADIAFNVFFNTACNVATVYSSASARLDFVAEWAKNTAANISPTPVNTISSPITGILIVCLIFAFPKTHNTNHFF